MNSDSGIIGKKPSARTGVELSDLLKGCIYTLNLANHSEKKMRATGAKRGKSRVIKSSH